MFFSMSSIIGSRDLELPHRVLNFLLFSFFVFSAFAEAENVMLGESLIVHLFAIFFALYFSVAYYFSRVKKKWRLFSHLTVLLSFLGIAVFYVFDGGLFCGNGFYILVDIAIIITVFEGRKRYFYLFSLIILVVCLIWLEMYLPGIFEIITRRQCAINTFLAFFITVVSSIFLLLLFIVQLEEQKFEIEMLSKTDYLTGLLNRRGIWEKLSYLAERSVKKGMPFSIILADLDDFKKVNDTYGHLCGDEALKEISKRMQNALRSGDILGRWGGEEFLVILPFADFKNAAKVAERIKNSVISSPIVCGKNQFVITLTMGVGEFNDNLSLDKNLALIDRALYGGKNSGKNRIVCVNKE